MVVDAVANALDGICIAALGACVQDWVTLEGFHGAIARECSKVDLTLDDALLQSSLDARDGQILGPAYFLQVIVYQGLETWVKAVGLLLKRLSRGHGVVARRGQRTRLLMGLERLWQLVAEDKRVFGQRRWQRHGRRVARARVGGEKSGHG